MRRFMSALILLLSLFAPVERLDVAKLQPVEAVAVYHVQGVVVLETDTGDKGMGETAVEALRDLKKSAAAVVYLDTARYLLVGENASDSAQQLRSFLKGSVRVGRYSGGDVKQEAKYLEVHGNLPKLKDWNGAE